ncbi:hypothetical protein HMPREF9946_03124 [Acetobacteraceae bacterium AT-5844]|nr:hypothetical protein HMPREF9946_03124 [Acetobacteraceae bacterium AT-5844]
MRAARSDDPGRSRTLAEAGPDLEDRDHVPPMTEEIGQERRFSAGLRGEMASQEITDLKAALEGLREAWPECWALRNNGAPMDPEVRAVADTLLIGERAGLLTKDKPVAGLVPLAECSPGLFLFGDCLGFLSEYGDPYVVSTGEAFWGGTSTKEARASLMVKPHTAANKPGDAMEKLISEIDGDFAIARSCYDFVPNSTNNAISDALGIMQKRVRSALQRAKGGGA